jgi:hypothetical protein
MQVSVPDYFAVEKFGTNIEQRINAVGERITVTSPLGQQSTFGPVRHSPLGRRVAGMIHTPHDDSPF